MCFTPQRRALFRHLNLQKWREHVVLCTFWLRNVLRATTACTFSTSQLPKVVREWCVLYIFDLEMCFAPQRRALFRHLNFQKWSEHGVFCTVWLGNVLRATTACTFSTSQLPKLLRTPQFLTHFTSKCASRHNSVHFFNISSSKSGPTMVCFVHFDFKMCFAPQRVQLFISHLPRCLRTRRFSEPTFQPSGATKPRKNTVFRDFPTFSRTCSSFFWSFLFWLFSLLTAFSSLHIVGSLTSKLPSMTICQKSLTIFSTKPEEHILTNRSFGMMMSNEGLKPPATTLA